MVDLFFPDYYWPRRGVDVLRVVGVRKPSSRFLVKAEPCQDFDDTLSFDARHDEVEILGFPLVVRVDGSNATATQHSFYSG